MWCADSEHEFLRISPDGVLPIIRQCTHCNKKMVVTPWHP